MPDELEGGSLEGDTLEGDTLEGLTEDFALTHPEDKDDPEECETCSA